MNNICEIKKCTACAACYNACAKNAVKFICDEFAVKHAYIDENLCVDCGLCKTVCPVNNRPSFSMPQKAIAAYTKDENDKKTVSSGGMATAIYKKIIGDGGIGYGVTAKRDHAEFIRIESVADADLLKGSKYVEAEVGDVYKSVKQYLSSGKKCVFIGTPCQVAGLKNYLGKEYENFYSIDLICHGVPPKEYLSEYLKNKLSNACNITFRGKRDYYFSAYDANDKIIYSKKCDEDPYFNVFLNGISLRENCYSCAYAKAERVSDLTIGDFWGIGKDALNGYKGKISLMLINTEKGNVLFNEISPLITYEERSVLEAVNGNAQLRRPSLKSPLRNDFLTAYQTRGFIYALTVTGINKKCKRNLIRNRIMFFPRKIKKILKKLLNK